MTLKTASLPTLREENTAGIVTAQVELREASLPGHSRNRSAERRLDSYLEKRVLLENASCKLNQVESYGLDQWNDRFVRLAQITVPNSDRFSDARLRVMEAELREKVWRAIPPSRFKRFQEIFCDPHNYVVPRFTVDRRGNVTFIGRPDFATISVAGCLVSVDRIPDEFCEKVRLVKFNDEERKRPLERFKRKTDIAVINRLKRLWDSSDAVSEHDFRVFIIQNPMNEATNRYKNTGPFPPGFHGTLLFTREDMSDRVPKERPLLGPKFSNPRRISHFVTVYGAARRTELVDLGYVVEQQELVPLRTRVEIGRKRIDSEWKRGASQDARDSVRSEVKGTLGGGAEMLGRDVGWNKARAAALMAKAVDSRDSTGRLNPRATSVVMERVARHLGSRLGEVGAKKRHNQTDQGLLNEIINREEAVLERFRVVLAENADKVMLRKQETATRSIVAAMQTKPVADVLVRLVPNRKDLESITARPFSTFAGLLRVGCDELEGNLGLRRFTAAKQSAVKLHIVGKLFAVNVNLERMKDCLVDPEKIPFDYMKREILDMSRVLAVHILKRVYVEEYERTFQALSRRIAALDAVLDDRPAVRSTLEDRKEYFKRLKTAVDAITPEKLAWQLVPEKWRKASGQTDPVKPA